MTAPSAIIANQPTDMFSRLGLAAGVHGHVPARNRELAGLTCQHHGPLDRTQWGRQGLSAGQPCVAVQGVATRGCGTNGSAPTDGHLRPTPEK